MDNQSFKIRDLRQKEQFIIDDVYLDRYAKIFGPSGTVVYISLCRRANKQQSCWPSEIKIANDHGMTDRTVRKYIKIFADARLIRIGHERTQSGKWPHNIYYLLDKSEWKKPEEIISSGRQRKMKTAPKENNNQNRRKQIPLKDAQEKEAHKKDDPVRQNFEENQKSSVNGFEPKNNDEFRCWEIAQWLGEENMNFILYYLKRYGLRRIEQALGIVKEDLQRKGLKNKRSYFNAVLRNIVNGRKNDKDLL